MTSRVVDPGRVSETPLVAPGATGGLLDVFRRRYLLRLLVQKELAARYQGSFLGLLWSYVQPLTRFVMYYFVIGIVLGLHKNVENFAIHIFCGLVFVHYFTETFSSGTRSIVRNRQLVKKMALPREMFPVSAMLVSLYHTVPQMVILTIASWAIGWTPTVSAFFGALLGFMIIGTFGMSLALLFSAANVFFRDFQNVVSTLTQFIHYAVPMIYPFSKLAESSLGGTWVETVYLMNPIAEAVLLLQNLFWVSTTSNPAATAATDLPDHLFTRGLIEFAVCLVVLALSQLAFTRLENKFAERL
ncbi:MAG TPA: ABC transporter permease [Nocardioidaceae bacterium]|jgi:ABC-2 type transport system permease protein